MCAYLHILIYLMDIGKNWMRDAAQITSWHGRRSAPSWHAAFLRCQELWYDLVSRVRVRWILVRSMSVYTPVLTF